MKEFMIKHPWMTFFGVLAIIDGITSIAKIVAIAATSNVAVLAIDNEEEDKSDEPAGDIQ